jgi:hypothetical protein
VLEARLTTIEESYMAALREAIRARDRAACLQTLSHLEVRMGTESLACLLTDLMAELAPHDFDGALWLLSSSEQEEVGALEELFSDELAHLAQPRAETLLGEQTVLISLGIYALTVLPDAGIAVVHRESGRRLGIYPDEASALDAMLALDTLGQTWECPAGLSV